MALWGQGGVKAAFELNLLSPEGVLWAFGGCFLYRALCRRGGHRWPRLDNSFFGWMVAR